MSERQRLPSSRKLAQALDRSHYFTGHPCKRGHTAPRWTVDGKCVECARLKGRESYTGDKAHYQAKSARKRIEQEFPEAIPENLDMEAVEAIYRDHLRLAQETGETNTVVAMVIPPQLGGMYVPDNLAIMTRSDMHRKRVFEDALYEVLTEEPDPLGTLREHRKDLQSLASDLPEDVAERILDHVTELAAAL